MDCAGCAKHKDPRTCGPAGSCVDNSNLLLSELEALARYIVTIIHPETLAQQKARKRTFQGTTTVLVILLYNDKGNRCYKFHLESYSLSPACNMLVMRTPLYPQI